MNKESKLNLNAGDYAIRHCDLDKLYNGFEVHKMLCGAYIAGNNDTLEDEDEWIKKSIFKALSKKDARDVLISQGVEVSDALAWIERQGEHSIACSEEQMKVLDEVLNFAANHESSYWNDYIFETLNNLIRQLKN